MTILNSLYVIVHEDGDEMLDIHITATLDKMLKKRLNTRSHWQLSQKEQELENDDDCFE